MDLKARAKQKKKFWNFVILNKILLLRPEQNQSFWTFFEEKKKMVRRGDFIQLCQY